MSKTLKKAIEEAKKRVLAMPNPHRNQLAYELLKVKGIIKCPVQ